MCSRLSSGGSIKPGSWNSILRKNGNTQLSIYGFGKGAQYNARFEGLDTTWKKLSKERGILRVDSFWEKNTEYRRTDHKFWNIAVICSDNNEFAILTMPANELVKKVHHRMPVTIVDQDVEKFLEADPDNDHWRMTPLEMFMVSGIMQQVA